MCDYYWRQRRRRNVSHTTNLKSLSVMTSFTILKHTSIWWAALTWWSVLTQWPARPTSCQSLAASEDTSVIPIHRADCYRLRPEGESSRQQHALRHCKWHMPEPVPDHDDSAPEIARLQDAASVWRAASANPWTPKGWVQAHLNQGAPAVKLPTHAQRS